MLKTYPGFETTDPEVNQNILVSHFNVRHFDCAHKERPFLAKANWATTKYLRVTSAYCSISTDTKYEAVPAVRQFIHAGPATRIDFEMNRRVTSLTSDAPIFVVPADTGYRCKPINEHAVIALRIEVSALANIATAMVGETVTAEKILVEQWNSDWPQNNFVNDALRFVDDLDSRIAAGSYAAETLGQALLVRFMLSGTSGFANRLRRQVPAPSVTQLKAIEEYIAANWQKGIDIKDIADEFGISVRTIFRYFKSRRGITPFDFLKNLKLEHARSMLQAADEADGVMRIALRCGFQGMGHFAREYQKHFGELPSETLRRARSAKSPTRAG